LMLYIYPSTHTTSFQKYENWLCLFTQKKEEEE
jgi:hypothetical protein